MDAFVDATSVNSNELEDLYRSRTFVVLRQACREDGQQKRREVIAPSALQNTPPLTLWKITLFIFCPPSSGLVPQLLPYRTLDLHNSPARWNESARSQQASTVISSVPGGGQVERGPKRKLPTKRGTCCCCFHYSCSLVRPCTAQSMDVVLAYAVAVSRVSIR